MLIKLPSENCRYIIIADGYALSIRNNLDAYLNELNSSAFVDNEFYMTSSMEEMNIGARKINETGVTLREVSEQIGGSIGQIGQQVDQFKI